MSACLPSELVRRAVTDHDSVALAELLCLYHHSLSSAIAGGVDEAESGVAVDDVLQQAYLAAFRGLASCRAENETTFRAWLETIARHELQNLLRAQRARKRRPAGRRLDRVPHVDESSFVDLLHVVARDSQTPSQIVATQEAVTAVRVGVASLPEDQRQAVELRYLAGKSLAETAAELGRSPAAVRGLVWRAQQSLRDLLGRSSRWFSRNG